MLPQPWGLAAEFGSSGQFSSSSRSLRALSFEDLCQLASLQGIFLSWSRSCTYCLGSLSERCLLQRIGKPVKFFSLMGSFGARITWFQPSFSYNQSPTGRKNKDKKKKRWGEREERRRGEKHVCSSSPSSLRLSPSNRGKALCRSLTLCRDPALKTCGDCCRRCWERQRAQEHVSVTDSNPTFVAPLR